MTFNICVGLILIGSVIGNPISGDINDMDICTVGSNVSLVGYMIEHLNATESNNLRTNFEKHFNNTVLKHDFETSFGKNILDVINNLRWHYSFESVRKVASSKLLKDSLTCVFPAPPAIRKYWKSGDNLIRILNHAASRGDDINYQVSSPPLPISDISDDDSDGQLSCNFARATYHGDQYYFAICLIGDFSDGTVTFDIVSNASINYVIRVINNKMIGS